MGRSSSSPKDQGSLRPSNGEESPEESSWTYYLADFSQPTTAGIRSVDQKEDSSWSHGGSSSLISDAASMAATWHVTKNKEMWLGPKSSWKKLSFKKRRSRSGAFEDDDLQDTATSPVNSPKISEMKHFEESTDVSKKLGESDHSKLQERTSTHQEELAVCFDEGAGIESSELRKRGLCLVSVSMLTNLM